MPKSSFLLSGGSESPSDMLIKSGIGVRFAITFTGKNFMAASGIINRKIGSNGKKYRIKATIDSAVFLNINAKSIAMSIYPNDWRNRTGRYGRPWVKFTKSNVGD
jgi:hypothetical protein